MEPEVKKMTLRLPEQLYEALKQISLETGISIHALVLVAIHLYLNTFCSTTSPHR